MHKEVEDKAIRELRSRGRFARLVHLITFIVVVVIPLSVVILGIVSPLVAVITLVYSIWQPVYKGLKFLKIIKKSKKELKHEEEERLKQHYFVHCQENPAGFQRLKIENFERELRNGIKKEVEQLTNKNKVGKGKDLGNK